jgi:hypothetical protein
LQRPGISFVSHTVEDSVGLVLDVDCMGLMLP